MDTTFFSFMKQIRIFYFHHESLYRDDRGNFFLGNFQKITVYLGSPIY